MATKRALLVGCNYDKTQFYLHGCINDVETMRNLIISELGFDTGDVKVLTDAPTSSVLPTGENIKDELQDMVKSAKAGDVLFLYFSGHGTAVPALSTSNYPRLGNVRFREDEAIVPCDFNIITDTDFKEILEPLAEQVSFTILSDSCHSGALIDKGREQTGLNTLEMKPKPFPYTTRVKRLDFNVICEKLNASIHFDEKPTTISKLFYHFFPYGVSRKFRYKDYSISDIPEHKGLLMSGCEANQTSVDVVTNGKAYGAFTDAVQQVINTHSGKSITNKQLVTEARKILRCNGFEQLPCLYCNKSNASTLFLGGVV